MWRCACNLFWQVTLVSYCADRKFTRIRGRVLMSQIGVPGVWCAHHHQTKLRIPAARCARAVLVFSAQRGRGERRMPVAPAASCALGSGRSTRVTTSTPESPDVPARNGFNGFLRALVTGLSCLRRLRIWPIRARSGRHASEDLTPTSEASGPHDFAVRCNIVRQLAV